MAFILKDRVKENTTSTGTGAVSLSGAASTFDTFQSYMVNGDTTYYAIVSTASGVDEWEVGLGTWNTGNTLTRTTVLAGSNGTSTENFSAGPKDVFMTYPAAHAALAGDDVDFANITVTGTVDGRDVAADGTKLDTVEQNADVTDAINVAAAGALMKSGGTMTGNLILNGDPTVALGAATKEYVDTIAAAGIHYHTPVRVEAPLNLTVTYNNGTAGVGATLTNAGTQEAITIDGVALSSGDRVLVYEQTDATQNGIYTVTTVGDGSTNWVLTRATDADSYGVSDPDAFGEGDAFFVKEGATGAGELYVMNTSGTITFGTTNITFTVIAETAVYSAGTGLTLTGTTFAIGQDVGTTANVTFNQVTAAIIGNVTGNVTGNLTGNADTASALETARTVQLSGDVTGSATFDGSANINITASVQDDSHAHVISNVDGLQTALDAKADDSTTITAGSGLTGGGSIGVNRTISHADTSTQASLTALTGAAVVSDVDVDTYGHVTGLSTRNMTLADLGYTGETNATADQTITAGSGLSGGGTGNVTLSHSDTSSQASVNNSNGTVIQDITLDTYGHLTGVNSVNLDGRYYTETEADSRFVNVTGDTLTGPLVISTGSTNNDYNEGLRLTRADNDWTGITFGSTGNSGAPTGGWFAATNPSAEFIITPDNSGNTTGLTLIKNGAAKWRNNSIFHDGYHPNADKWTTSRTLTLSGDASGSVSWDGSSNATLGVTVNNVANTGYGDGNFTWYQTSGNFQTWTGGWASHLISNHGNGSTYYNQTIIMPFWGAPYYMRKEGGVNTGPYKFWTEENDGSGSGLDADFLDGLHAGSFLRSDTDDTLTGNLQINSHVINMDLNNISDNAIELREVRDSTWPFQFVTNDVGNDNPSGFWVGSNGYPDMRLRRENGTVRALISSWEESYVSNGFRVGGALDATSSSGNEFNGHHYFTAYDGNGNHYPHYRSGSNNNGAQVNLRVQNNAGNWDVLFLDADNNNITWRGNKMWNAANDGSGSGLDADLLDGVHGSSFLRSDANDSFSGNIITTSTNGIRFGNPNETDSNDGYIAAGKFSTGLNIVGTQTTAGTGRQVRIWGNVITDGGSRFFHDGYHPNADKWTTARTLSLSGDASGSVSWDGSGNATLSVAVNDNSHTHTNTTLDMHFGRQTQNIDTYDPDSYWATSKATGGSGSYPTNYVNVYNFAGNGSSEGTQLATYYGSNNDTWIRSRSDSTNSWLGWDKVWTSGSDGSGSGLDADLLDGYHSAENGGSVNLRTASNGYLQIRNWVDVGSSGIFSSTTNSAHFYPNTSSSYGTWRVGGSRNGYTGFLLDYAGGASNSGVHIMYDASGNGGVWKNAWHYYFHEGNNCLGVAASATSSAYELYVSGDIYATGNVTAYSDERKKENIETIDGALDMVTRMRGVRYNKIGNPVDDKEVGVIAQEMQEVCPESVVYAEDVDEYGVRYGNLVGVLIEAIKEQQTQIDELKAKLGV